MAIIEAHSFRRFLAVCFVLALLGPAARAGADTRFGLRGGYYTDAEGAFVGVELLTRIASRVYLNPNIEYVFVDNVKYSTWNADFHYDLPTHGSTFVWLGAGLALLVFDPDGPDNSSTDVGANFLAGVGFKSGSVIPYFQVKAIAKEGSGEVALAFGLRF